MERTPEVRHETVNSEESTREWRLLLKNEIDKPTEVPPILRAVNDRLSIIWDVYKNEDNALKDKINSFICTTLCESIINYNKN